MRKTDGKREATSGVRKVYRRRGKRGECVQRLQVCVWREVVCGESAQSYHNHNIFVCVVQQFMQPPLQMFECGCACYIIHKQSSNSTTVVTAVRVCVCDRVCACEVMYACVMWVYGHGNEVGGCHATGRNNYSKRGTANKCSVRVYASTAAPP